MKTATSAIVVTAVKGKLILSQAAPPDPGDGGDPTDPNQPPPCTVPVVQIDSLVDGLTDPCLKAVLAALKNNNLNGKMSDIIHNVFGTNDNVNLHFDNEAYNFTGNTANTPALSDPAVVNNGTFNETVHLNLSQIGQANQDFDAVIIMHEILHDYMNYNNFYQYNQLKQHQEIAERYVDQMKSYLQSIYHTPDDAAYSMILNGLSDIFKGSLPAYMDYLKTKYNVSDPLSEYELYRQGIGGTGCPVPIH